MALKSGVQVNSLTQISRALKNGFAIDATLLYQEPSEHMFEILVYTAIYAMTDLHESAYNQLVGIEDDCGPCDPLTMYFSWWEFTIVER